MHVRTDDDVYRVDAVWLGPPNATFPWRARYASYGVGLLVMIAVMFLQRRLGVSLGFFSVAWALLVTVVVTRFVGRRIDEDRPLLEWLTLFVHELRGPRRRLVGIGSALEVGHVRVRRVRTRPVRTRQGADAGFGPPSAATVGGRARRPASAPAGFRSARALPPAAGPAGSAAATVAGWARATPPRRRTPDPVRVPRDRRDRRDREGDGAPPYDPV